MRRGIPFELLDVDEQPAAMDELRARGWTYVPVVRVDDTYLDGTDFEALAGVLRRS